MPEIPLLRFGRCTVCDQRTAFLLRNRMSNSMRSQAKCLRCGSRGRNRHVAIEAARAIGVSSLGDLREQSHCRVLNTSDQSPIGRRLGGLDHATNTGFWPDVEPGMIHEGVRNEDLTALTFADRTFDLVITEDVMEHVPDSQKAFQEIRRVLKPGGVHVFSIPYRIDRPSAQRFSVVDGEVVLDEPTLFHTDPGRGRIPVFHEYGYTLLDELTQLGFETRVVRSLHRDERRYAIIDCTTFVSRAV